MSQPLSLEEHLRLAAELDARCGPGANPAPHPDLPDQPGPGSNVAYLSAAEHDQMMALAGGLGWFGRQSEHDREGRCTRPFPR